MRKEAAVGNWSTLHFTAKDWENGAEKMNKIELSRTWKERHAKGVPVTFTSLQWQGYRRHDNWQIDHQPYLKWKVGEEQGTPIIGVYDAMNVRRATFCNFRYKQSWLDKKGGERG